jgi:hypothetical protein
MARTPLTTTLERIAEVREMMFSMAPESTVISFFARKWGVKPKTVQTYMHEVRKEWAEEQKQLATEDPTGDFRSSRRNIVRKALEKQAFRAMTRKVTRYKSDGQAVVQTIPDEKTFSRAVRELIELDDLRISPEIRVSGNVSMVHDVGPSAFQELVGQLRGKRRRAVQDARQPLADEEADQAGV